MGKVSSKNNRRRTSAKIRLPKKRHPTKGRVSDAFVAQRWDHGKTVAQNMSRMGLVANLNSEVRLASSKPLRLNATSAVEFLSIVDGIAPTPASGTLHVVSDKQTKDFMKADETEYLKALIAKHGQDFVKMARDSKTNYLQHSAAHLETRIARLARFEASKGSAAATSGMEVDDVGATETGADKGARGAEEEGAVNDDDFVKNAKSGLKVKGRGARRK